MPRPPKFIHPIRIIRQIIGDYSQERFSALVGNSAHTIKAVELGRLPLSDDLAKRIMVATGAHPDSIKKKSGSPKNMDGNPFSKEDFDRWNQLVFNPEVPPNIIYECKELASICLTIQHSAYRIGKLLAVQYLFSEWIKSEIDPILEEQRL